MISISVWSAPVLIDNRTPMMMSPMINVLIDARCWVDILRALRISKKINKMFRDAKLVKHPLRDTAAIINAGLSSLLN